MFSGLRFALRSLRKTPGFSLVGILLIAIGLAAATTAFTLVHTLFYKARPGIADPATLFNIHTPDKAGDLGAWSYPDFQGLRDSSRQMRGIAAFTALETGLASGQQSERVLTQLVSANFFEVLGARPALGRFFRAEEEKTNGTHAVAVISHRRWQGQFAGDAGILGRSVRVNGLDFTIIGVAEPGFHGTFIGFDMDLWLPIAMARVASLEGDLTLPDAHWLELLGRLAPGADVLGAQTELTGIKRRLQAGRDADIADLPVKLLPTRPADDSLRGSALGFAGALSATAGLVLVIACLNVSGLLLSRAEGRRRENAVRLALGCSRARLVLEGIRESLLVFAAGGALGLLFTKWIAGLDLLGTPTDFIPLAFAFAPDWWAFAFCFGIALVAGILTSLAPAWNAARTDLVEDLKIGGSHGATGRSRLRSALVIGQLAFCLVPLVLAGLFVRLLEQASRVPPGFAPDGLLVTELNVTLLGDDYQNKGAETCRRLLERARTLPGVTAATLTSRLPLGRGSLSTLMSTDHPATPEPKNGFRTALTYVDESYFSTLQIPLATGRAFTSADDKPGAIVINETTARRLFGAAEPLEREIRIGPTSYRVVGVSRDVKYSHLWEEPRLQVYLPLAPNPRPRLWLAVRHEGPATALAPTLQRALLRAAPDLPLASPIPAREHIEFTLFAQKFGARVAAVLGGISVLLAAIGLYGLLSLDGLRQAREFGVRLALGAQSRDLVALIAGRAARLVGLGLLLGGVLAAGAGTLLQDFLPLISPLDPTTYLTVVLLLGLIALAAMLAPARRATRVDPIAALRSE